MESGQINGRDFVDQTEEIYSANSNGASSKNKEAPPIALYLIFLVIIIAIVFFFVKFGKTGFDVFGNQSVNASLAPTTITTTVSQIQSAPSSAELSLKSWSTTTPLPIPSNKMLFEPICVAYMKTIYCAVQIGDENATVKEFYAPIIADGIGEWNAGSILPFVPDSCFAANSIIYCTGGLRSTYTNASYYSTISSSNVPGPWLPTSAFPLNISEVDCTDSGSYVYCSGAYNAASANNIKYNSSYYAQLSNMGIGNWHKTTPYPLKGAGKSCDAYGNYIYCLGGNLLPSLAPTSFDYYAPLFATGIGAWHETTTPFEKNSSISTALLVLGQSCVAYDSYIYCIGGQNASLASVQYSTYSAKLSSSGISNWSVNSPYGFNTYNQSCVAADGQIICVGGRNSNSGHINNSTIYAN